MTPLQLKTIRQSLGLSQTKLAERLQVSTNTVWRWESGFTPINYVTEMAISHLKCQQAPDEPEIVDDEPAHRSGCICADCAGAELTADND